MNANHLLMRDEGYDRNSKVEEGKGYYEPLVQLEKVVDDKERHMHDPKTVADFIRATSPSAIRVRSGEFWDQVLGDVHPGAFTTEAILNTTLGYLQTVRGSQSAKYLSPIAIPDDIVISILAAEHKSYLDSQVHYHSMLEIVPVDEMNLVQKFQFLEKLFLTYQLNSDTRREDLAQFVTDLLKEAPKD